MRRGYFSLGMKDIFDPKGRIDRLTYFMYGAVLSIMSYFLAMIVVPIASIMGGALDQLPSVVRLCLIYAISLPLLYAQYCISAKRLHDFNMPGLLALLVFTPTAFGLCIESLMKFDHATISAAMVVSFFYISLAMYWLPYLFGAVLVLIPGTKGPNRYGLPHMGEDRPRAHVLEG